MNLLRYFFFRTLKKHRFGCRYSSIRKANSYVFKNGSVPLSDVTFTDILDNAADTCGDHTALISAYQGISKNCWDLRKEAEKLASGFLSCGLQKGDRIAIYSPNCYEWTLTQFAAAKAGLILVAINYACTPQELEHCLTKTRCKAVISYEKLIHQDFYEIFNKIIPNLRTSNAGKIQSDRLPDLEKVIMMTDMEKEGIIRFKDVLEGGNRESDKALSEIQKMAQFDDPTHILFTSGTTGAPKAAIMNNHKAINSLIRVFHRLGYDKMEPVICCPVPFFHMFGCHAGSLGMIFNKSTIVLPSASYDCIENLKCIEKYKCNAIYATPTMLFDLLRRSKELKTDISTIKSIVTGASPLPESLIRDLYYNFENSNIHILYGLTETSGGLAQMRTGVDLETTLKGYIEPSELVELKIVDRKGHIVPKNVEGEICSRGYTNFVGYWEDKNKTADTIDENGWLHTGDIGVMNDEGWVKIVGRIKDIVIRGGENIHLTEVENFLSTHPDVLEAYVCGVPDIRLGEELCCWITVKSNTNLTEDDIREFCKGKISYYKIPRYIMFVEDFPKTTSGKIKKYEMVEISKKKLNL